MIHIAWTVSFLGIRFKGSGLHVGMNAWELVGGPPDGTMQGQTPTGADGRDESTQLATLRCDGAAHDGTCAV